MRGSLVSARVEGLRREFPVLDRIAYLNAGTAGPVPARAVDAAERSLRIQSDSGRGGHDFFEGLIAEDLRLRERVAGVTGAATEEVTVTGATTDGVNAALLSLGLRAGDEVLTSDEEHPGVLAPLAIARDSRGVRIRVAPFDELPGEVRPGTRLVACSHVSWMTGRVMDTTALASSDTTVLLDGAQALGALPLDLHALGCDFYAASGQKWMCGPNGLGYLYARASTCEQLVAPWPGYHVLEDPDAALESPVHTDVRRLGTGLAAPHQLAFAHASLDVLEEAGLPDLYESAAGQGRAARGRPRGCRYRGRSARALDPGLVWQPRPGAIRR